MADSSGGEVHHCEYFAYGKERYKEAPPAFNVSSRYTGQVFDEATGLYYYNARYYDPELGRFIQPDSLVPDPSDPQGLNRYSYVQNNPLVYVDPTGNVLWFIPLIIAGLKAAAVGAAIGGVIGGAVTAAQGGNFFQGFAAGAVAGGLTGFGIGFGGAAWGAGLGSAIGGALGGAAGGAAGAAIQGGNIGLGALIGGVSGFVFGALDPTPYDLNATILSPRAAAEAEAEAATAPAAGLTAAQASGLSGGVTSAANAALFVGQQLGDAGALREQYLANVAKLSQSYQDSVYRSVLRQTFRNETPPLVKGFLPQVPIGARPGVTTATRAAANAAARAFKIGGRVLVGAGLASDAARVALAVNPARELFKVSFGILGSLGGGILGTLAGSALTVNPVGGVVGGLAGAAAGGYYAEQFADYVFGRYEKFLSSL